MKTRLALLALAPVLPLLATPVVNVSESSSTFPLLAAGAIALGLVARRLRK
jgi:hypothetical protein